MANFVKIGKRAVNLERVQTIYYEQNGGLNYDSPCVTIDFGGAANSLSIFEKYEPETFTALMAWMDEQPALLGESDPDPFADPLEQAMELLKQKDYTVTEIKIRLGLSTYEEAYDLCQVARKTLREE